MRSKHKSNSALLKALIRTFPQAFNRRVSLRWNQRGRLQNNPLSWCSLCSAKSKQNTKDELTHVLINASGPIWSCGSGESSIFTPYGYAFSHTQNKKKLSEIQCNYAWLACWISRNYAKRILHFYDSFTGEPNQLLTFFFNLYKVTSEMLFASSNSGRQFSCFKISSAPEILGSLVWYIYIYCT